MVALKSPMNFRSHSLVELVSEGDCSTRVNFRRIHGGMLQVVGIFQHEKLTRCENASQESSAIWTFHSPRTAARPSTSSDDFVISVKTNIQSGETSHRHSVAKADSNRLMYEEVLGNKAIVFGDDLMCLRIMEETFHLLMV